MAGSFLQTTGIASQASDAFDTERQQRRLLSQREQANQSDLNDSNLYRAIVKMAYEHEAAKESAAAAAKARVKAAAPTAPVAPGSAPVSPIPAVPMLSAGTDPVQREDLDYANGGQLGEKFNGIYDDTKVGKELPTHFTEALSDWGKPGYKHGGLMHLAVHDIVHHANSYADGGPLADPNLDTGAEEDKKKIADELLSVGTASPQDVNAVVPGIKVMPNPSAIPGRLVNAAPAGGTPSLVTPGGHSSSGDRVQEIRDGQVMSTGNPNGDSSFDSQSNTNTPEAPPRGLAMLAAPFLGPLAPVFSVALALTQLARSAQAKSNPPTEFAPPNFDPPSMDDPPPFDPPPFDPPPFDPPPFDPPPFDPPPEPDTAPEGPGDGNGGGAGPGGPDGNADGGYGGFGSSGGFGGADDGGDGGDGGGEKNGGILWSYVKARMTPKSKPGAVKFKNGGKMRAGPGGQVRGRGTGTSDSVPAKLSGPSGSKHGINLSNGEYVLSADTVRAVGKDKLDALQARYHKQVR